MPARNSADPFGNFRIHFLSFGTTHTRTYNSLVTPPCTLSCLASSEVYACLFPVILQHERATPTACRHSPFSTLVLPERSPARMMTSTDRGVRALCAAPTPASQPLRPFAVNALHLTPSILSGLVSSANCARKCAYSYSLSSRLPPTPKQALCKACHGGLAGGRGAALPTAPPLSPPLMHQMVPAWHWPGAGAWRWLGFSRQAGQPRRRRLPPPHAPSWQRRSLALSPLTPCVCPLLQAGMSDMGQWSGLGGSHRQRAQQSGPLPGFDDWAGVGAGAQCSAVLLPAWHLPTPRQPLCKLPRSLRSGSPPAAAAGSGAPSSSSSLESSTTPSSVCFKAAFSAGTAGAAGPVAAAPPVGSAAVTAGGAACAVGRLPLSSKPSGCCSSSQSSCRTAAGHSRGREVVVLGV